MWGVRIWVAVVGALSASASLASPAAHADPPWSDPVVVAGSRTEAEFEPPVAVSTRSGSAVLWNQVIGDDEGVFVRVARFSQAGVPRRARKAIDRRVLRGGMVAITGGRDVLVAGFSRGFRVVVGRSATGERFHFQRLRRVPDGIRAINLAQATSGAAAVAYRAGRGRGYLAVRTPDRRRFGPSRRLFRKAGHDPVVAVNAQGDVLTVWKRRGRLWARSYDPSGRPGKTLRLAAASHGDPPIAVSLGADGRAVVAWLDRTMSEGTTVTSRLRASIADAAGRFSTPAELDTWTTEGFDVPLIHLRAVLADDGSAVVAWTGKHATRAAIASRETFTAPQDLGLLYGQPPAQGHVSIGLSTLSAGPNGEIHATFVSNRSTSSAVGAGGGTVQSAVLSPGATAFAPTETVATADAWSFGLPTGATNTASGRPVVAWHSPLGVTTATRTTD
jgi:hypothetical protein